MAEPTLTPEQERQAIKEQYPSFAPFFDIPEVGDLLLRAIREGFPPEKLESQMMATEWWKRTSEPARMWETELLTDPANARNRLFQRIAEVDRQLRRQGINPDQARLWTIADQSIRFDWDPDAIQRAVADEVRRATTSGGLPAGEAAYDADRLGAIARQYHVPMTRQTLETWALKILDQSATIDRFTSYVTGLARTRYASDPMVTQTLDAGMTVEDAFSAHKAELANTLEINSAEIDFLNPRWGAVTQFVDDKGTTRSMTLSEAGRWARGLDEYKRTKQAAAQGANLSQTLLKTFGEIA